MCRRRRCFRARPDAEVHQCRYGAVQERLHRRRKAPYAPPPPRRKRARRRQAQRSDNVGYTRGITRFSRCSAISRSGLFQDHASIGMKLVTRNSACEGQAHGHRLYRRTTKRRSLEEDRRPTRSRIIRIGGLDQFLADGRHWPAGLFETSTTRGQIWAAPPARGGRWRPFHRDLESRVHAVEQLAPGSGNPCEPSIILAQAWSASRRSAGQHDNYDIDLFIALIRPSPNDRADPQGEQKASLRVIADHLRASSS